MTRDHGAALLPVDDWLTDLARAAERDDDRWLAEALVRRGWAVGSHWLGGELTRQTKTSVSDFLTQADAQAEADIAAAIRAFRPDDGILGEEGTSSTGASGRRWIIDPIDGTYNYASRLETWCSAVALQGPGANLIGAIRQDSIEATWLGQVSDDGAAAWLNGSRLPRLADVPLAQVSLATYLHPTYLANPDALEPWLAACGGSATLRMNGSGSCDLARVATGRLGAFLQHSTADWDWYPGVALVLGAGGVAETVEHRGFRWHVAGGAGAVAQLIDRLRSA